MPVADFSSATFIPSHRRQISKIPATMLAAVYRGEGHVAAEEIPTPAIGRGEMLVRVETCGICHTDLKKVQHNLLPPPRIYGHEIAGVVAAVGEGVTSYSQGIASSFFIMFPAAIVFTVSGASMRSVRYINELVSRPGSNRRAAALRNTYARWIGLSGAGWSAFPTASASTKPAGLNR